MFTHVMVGTNDPDKARAFYDATFGALGISGQHTPEAARSTAARRPACSASTTPRDEQPATHANGGTIGFKAPDRAAVDAWHAAGMANGGSDEGPPGERAIWRAADLRRLHARSRRQQALRLLPAGLATPFTSSGRSVLA